MPLEIRELIIKVTVDQNRQNNNVPDLDDRLKKMKSDLLRELSEKIKNNIKQLMYNR